MILSQISNQYMYVSSTVPWALYLAICLGNSLIWQWSKEAIVPLLVSHLQTEKKWNWHSVWMKMSACQESYNITNLSREKTKWISWLESHLWKVFRQNLGMLHPSIRLVKNSHESFLCEMVSSYRSMNIFFCYIHLHLYGLISDHCIRCTIRGGSRIYQRGVLTNRMREKRTWIFKPHPLCTLTTPISRVFEVL